MMVKVSSNYDVALSAVSEFSQIGNSKGQQFSLGQSNIAGMKQAMEISNRIITDLTKLEIAVKEQANKFPQLASVIEQRDQQDSADFSQLSWGVE